MPEDKNNNEVEDLLSLDENVKVNPQMTSVDSNDQLEVHTMPDKFKKPVNTKAKKSNAWIWVVAAVLFLIGIGGGSYWFVTTYSNAPAEHQIEEPAAEEPVVEDPVVEEPVKFISARQNLSARIEDVDGMMLSQLRVTIPQGAMDQDYEIEIAPNEIDESSTSLNSDYRVVGGYYEISPTDINFTETFQLTIAYSADLVDVEIEEELAIAYWDDNRSDWMTISGGQVSTSNNLVRLDQIDRLESRYALVIDRQLIEALESEGGVISEIDIEKPDTADSDKDGLTDVEEEMFTTNADSRDTDGDGYDDRTEILNLYSPLQGPGEFLLAETNLVKEYNSTMGYRVLVPTTFVAEEIAPGTIAFQTGRDEFFQIIEQENPESLSIKEWFALQVPSVNYSQINTLNLNGLDAIVSPDSSVVYVSLDDKVYLLTYSHEQVDRIAFETTFEMFVNSFDRLR